MTEDNQINKPLVTVCITTFNRKALLPFTIESVIEQSYDNLEIIIVDDCSRDETDVIVSDFMDRDSRIKYIRHHENKGLAAARNSAIFNAKGKYFTFIDDDDLWDKMFVEKFILLAKHHEDNYVFCCGSKITYPSGKTIRMVPKFDGKLIDYVKNGYVPPAAGQFYIASEIKKVGGYNEKIRNGVDHDLWLTLAFKGYFLRTLEEALAIVNPNAKGTEERMTRNWDKRFKGITGSLQIWKHPIEDNLGVDFYRHFEMAYYQYLNKMFFEQSLKQWNLKKAWSFFAKTSNKKSLLIEEARLILRKTYIKCRLLTTNIMTIECKPSFPPFRGNFSLKKVTLLDQRDGSD